MLKTPIAINIIMSYLTIKPLLLITIIATNNPIKIKPSDSKIKMHWTLFILIYFRITKIKFIKCPKCN